LKLSKSETMNLSIIIVNYKTPDLLIACIDNIKRTLSNDLNYEIIFQMTTLKKKLNQNLKILF